MPEFILDGRKTAPSVDLAEVTPDDSNDLPGGPCRALRIGGAGDVKITTANGTITILKNCAAGSTEPHSARRVWSTSTTATDIHAVY